MSKTRAFIYLTLTLAGVLLPVAGLFGLFYVGHVASGEWWRWPLLLMLGVLECAAIALGSICALGIGVAFNECRKTPEQRAKEEAERLRQHALKRA